MNFISPYYVAFLSYKLFTYRALPEVWRLVTPFFITGPSFGLLMDPYFLYTYASQLETGAIRFSQPGDFFTYIAFVCSVILVSRVYYPRCPRREQFPYLITSFPCFAHNLPYCPASLS